MRWCPPGSFMMGSPDDEPGRNENEGPRHQVTFAQGFWMFETLCTEELWTAVMNRQASVRKRSRVHTIRSINWFRSQEFVDGLRACLAEFLLRGQPSMRVTIVKHDSYDFG